MGNITSITVHLAGDSGRLQQCCRLQPSHAKLQIYSTTCGSTALRTQSGNRTPADPENPLPSWRNTCQNVVSRAILWDVVRTWLLVYILACKSMHAADMPWGLCSAEHGTLMMHTLALRPSLPQDTVLWHTLLLDLLHQNELSRTLLSGKFSRTGGHIGGNRTLPVVKSVEVKLHFSSSSQVERSHGACGEKVYLRASP